MHIFQVKLIEQYFHLNYTHNVIPTHTLNLFSSLCLFFSLQAELSQALTSLTEKARSAKDFMVQLKHAVEHVQVGVLKTMAALYHISMIVDMGLVIVPNAKC